MTQKNSSIILESLEKALGLSGENTAFEKNRKFCIAKIANVGSADEGDIVFIAQERYLEKIENTKASIIVFNETLVDKIPSVIQSKKICLAVKDAMLAFAKASIFFSQEIFSDAKIHSTAVIHSSAKIGVGVSIGAYAVIGENAVVGDHSILHPHVSIGRDAYIGSNCVLFPHVCLYAGVQLGDRVRIHASSVIGADGFGYVQEKMPTGVRHVKIHHMGSVKIGNDVEVGASTCIDRGTIGDTTIGNGSIIDNQVQIGHNCEIGEGVVICGNSGLAGSAKIGKFSVLAGFVAIDNKTEIGAGTMISGFSMVFGKVPPGIKWGGVPARPLKEYFRLQALVGRLPELFQAYKLAKKEELERE